MVRPEDLAGRVVQRVACSWFDARGQADSGPELLHIWLQVSELGSVRFHTLDHHLDLQIDAPHASYDMDEFGHVTVGNLPDSFALAPFVGSEILAVRHVRQRSVGMRVGFEAAFAAGSVRILALADELVVTADRLSDAWENDLEFDHGPA